MSQKQTIQTLNDVVVSSSVLIQVMREKPKDAPFVTEHDLLQELNNWDAFPYVLTPELLTLIIGVSKVVGPLSSWKRKSDSPNSKDMAWAYADHALNRDSIVKCPWDVP